MRDPTNSICICGQKVGHRVLDMRLLQAAQMLSEKHGVSLKVKAGK